MSAKGESRVIQAPQRAGPQSPAPEVWARLCPVAPDAVEGPLAAAAKKAHATLAAEIKRATRVDLERLASSDMSELIASNRALYSAVIAVKGLAAAIGPKKQAPAPSARRGPTLPGVPLKYESFNELE